MLQMKKYSPEEEATYKLGLLGQSLDPYTDGEPATFQTVSAHPLYVGKVSSALTPWSRWRVCCPTVRPQPLPLPTAARPVLLGPLLRHILLHLSWAVPVN